MEPPSGITYKDQALSLEELQARPPSGITYKDQALSLEELQARGGSQPAPHTTGGEVPMVTAVEVPPYQPYVYPPPPPQQQAFLPPPPPQHPMVGSTADPSTSRHNSPTSQRKWWIIGGIVLVVVLAGGVGAGVGIAAGGGGSEASVTNPGDAPTPAITASPTTAPVPPLGASTIWSPGVGVIRGSAAGDYMGVSVALSADARFLAVGANQQNSTRQGYVQVFVLDGSDRTQLGTDILGEKEGDSFGDSLDISDDGTILAVGASGFKGSDGVRLGQVRVFQRNADNNWLPLGQSLQGEISSSNFGFGVQLSQDGRTMIVSSPFSSPTGVVYVYRYDPPNNIWNLLGDPLSVVGGSFDFGYYVAISADGLTVAVSDIGQDQGVLLNGESVLVFTYDDSSQEWNRLGQILAGQRANEGWGAAVSLSADGRVVAGSTSDFSSNQVLQSSEVRVYAYNNAGLNRWEQIGQSIDMGTDQGASIKLSADGKTLVTSSIQEASQRGTGAPEVDGPGLVRVFTLDDDSWIQVGDDILGVEDGDAWGFLVDLSADGRVFVAGAIYNDDSGFRTGHVRVFEANG